MNLEDIAVGVTIVLLVLALYGGYYLYLYPKFSNRFEYFALSKFKEFLAKLQSPYHEYSYFTDGHIIWSETDISEILNLIHKNCRGHAPEVGIAAKPAQFLLHADESNKRVYIVFTRAKSFDWQSVPHYDEYTSGEAGLPESERSSGAQ